MKLVVITAENQVNEELPSLLALLAAGAIIHIRKPQLSNQALSSLLDSIPAQYRSQLVMHNAIALAKQYHVGGIHFRDNSTINSPSGWTGTLSQSLHTLANINDPSLSTLDYCFISPVFDSISKKGYSSNFTMEQLRPVLKDKTTPNLYALGGVTSSNMELVKEMGFQGAAVLGAVWTLNDTTSRMREFEKLMAYV